MSITRGKPTLAMVWGIVVCLMLFGLGSSEAGARGQIGLAWLHHGKQGSLARFNKAMAAESSGARHFLQGKEIERYTLADLTEQIRQRSLLLAKQAHLIRQAKADVAAAQAVFDPDFSASIQYSRSKGRERKDSFTRTRKIPRTWEEVTDGDVGTSYPLDDGGIYVIDEDDVGKTWFELGLELAESTAAAGCLILDGNPVGDTCSSEIHVTTEDEYASGDSDWSQSWSGSLRLSKFLGWGGRVQAGLNTTYTPYDVSQERSLKSMGYVLETALDLGDEAWASDVSVGFSMPLPFSKNFGTQGTYASVAAEQADLVAQKAAQARDFQLNNELKRGLIAYWEVARAVLAVESALSRRSAMEGRVSRVRRLLANQRITEYDLVLARSSVQDAHHQEEVAWNNLMVRTNNLVEILDLPPEKVVLPEGFLAVLLAREDGDSGEALSTALARRAELKMAQFDVDGHQREAQFRSNQLKPDLAFSASYKVLGKGGAALFGYDSFGDSLRALKDSDERNLFVGLSFNYPLGNHAAQSKHAQARADYQHAVDRMRYTEVTLAQEVNHALGELHGRQSRVRLAHANVRLAGEAYQAAQRLREAEKVTEFDLLQRYQALNEARIALIHALIDRQQADVHLLAAQGLLGQGEKEYTDPEAGAEP